MKRRRAIDQERAVQSKPGQKTQKNEKRHPLHPVLKLQQVLGNQGILALRRQEPLGMAISQGKRFPFAERNPAMRFPPSSTGLTIRRQNGPAVQTDFTAGQLTALKNVHAKAYEMLSNVITICKEIFIFMPAKGESLNDLQKQKSAKIVELIKTLFGDFDSQVLADIIWNCDFMKSVMQGIQYTYDASVDTAEGEMVNKIIRVGNGFLESNIHAQRWILLHEIGHLAGLKHTGGFQGLVFYEKPSCPPDVPEMKTEEAVRNADINAAFIYCVYTGL